MERYRRAATKRNRLPPGFNGTIRLFSTQLVSLVRLPRIRQCILDVIWGEGATYFNIGKTEFIRNIQNEFATDNPLMVYVTDDGRLIFGAMHPDRDLADLDWTGQKRRIEEEDDLEY